MTIRMKLPEIRFRQLPEGVDIETGCHYTQHNDVVATQAGRTHTLKRPTEVNRLFDHVKATNKRIKNVKKASKLSEAGSSRTTTGPVPIKEWDDVV
jgi:hypothetical protein